METSQAEMESRLSSARDVTRETSYAGWSQHCITHHSKVNGKAHADDGDKDDDGVARSKLQSKAKAAAKKKPQPKAKAVTKRTGCLKKGS